MSLGEAIRKRRKSLGLTLQVLAEKIASDPGNLSRIERGAQNVSEAQLLKICEVLNCAPSSLFQNKTSPNPIQKLDSQTFAKWFRLAAPYINTFSNKTFVIAFGGELLDEDQFTALSHDINLLTCLNVKIVLVHGARPQIDQKLKEKKISTQLVRNVRVTDDSGMEAVKEANGLIKINIESTLSSSLLNSPMAGSDIKVSSGNFITAKPLGVIDGVDMQHTGEVRKIDSAAIKKKLDNKELVVISPIGYSPTGEVFNLTMEDVALKTSIALEADKLILLIDSDGIFNLRNELLHEMTLEKAVNLYKSIAKDNPKKHELININSNELDLLEIAIKASEAGIHKIHLINRHIDGAILQELFTDEGVGTVITEKALDTIRQANHNDVKGIHKLINPLEAGGYLIKRGKERIDHDIENFFVIEHDKKIIGCAALYPYNDHVEFACFAINKNYQSKGFGSKLYNYCEEIAREKSYKYLFALTTRTEHWFIEKGFKEESIQKLPKKRLESYLPQRNSKFFIKKL
jgi:amino-acid N-acetyltransferase